MNGIDKLIIGCVNIINTMVTLNWRPKTRENTINRIINQPQQYMYTKGKVTKFNSVNDKKTFRHFRWENSLPTMYY